MKEYKQLGAYGLVINDNKILLIKKSGGPYDGKLDLPGGTIEFCERPEDALKREFKEEIGADITVKDFLGLEENIFTFNGKTGHELIFVYNVDVKIRNVVSPTSMPINAKKEKAKVEAKETVVANQVDAPVTKSVEAEEQISIYW